MPALLPPCCPRSPGKQRQEMSRDLQVGVRHQTLLGWGNISAQKEEFPHHPTDKNATQDFPAGISPPVCVLQQLPAMGLAVPLLSRNGN